MQKQDCLEKDEAEFPAFTRMSFYFHVKKIIMYIILEIILITNWDGVKEKINIILKRSFPYDFKAMAPE